jgi:hypothetical protein
METGSWRRVMGGAQRTGMARKDAHNQVTGMRKHAGHLFFFAGVIAGRRKQNSAYFVRGS